MWKRCCGIAVVLLGAWILASCTTAAKNSATPVPEAEQAVGTDLKELYMAASASSPRSPAQQKVILKMAEKASNGKELMLVMRATVGVFPPGGDMQVCSIVTDKLMRLGTLDQLIEYATAYCVAPDASRPFVHRMIELAGGNADAREWYRIRVAASRLKLGDLAQQAQVKGDELSAQR